MARPGPGRRSSTDSPVWGTDSPSVQNRLAGPGPQRLTSRTRNRRSLVDECYVRELRWSPVQGQTSKSSKGCQLWLSQITYCTFLFALAALGVCLFSPPRSSDKQGSPSYVLVFRFFGAFEVRGFGMAANNSDERKNSMCWPGRRTNMARLIHLVTPI